MHELREREQRERERDEPPPKDGEVRDAEGRAAPHRAPPPALLDQGFHYNTPFDAPGVGFADVAAYLRDVAATDHGAFDRIFLFVVATNDLAQLYP